MPRRLAGLIDTRFTLNHVVPSSTALHADALPRLASLRVKSKSVHYIHLHLLMQDLKAAIKGFAKGDVLDLGCRARGTGWRCTSPRLQRAGG